MAKQCNTCAFSQTNYAQIFECHRYAHKGHGNWPLVEANDWCGDWASALPGIERQPMRLGGWNPESGLFDG